MCWQNTLARCRRTRADNIASSFWLTSNPAAPSSTRRPCRTPSHATGARGPVSAPENSPKSTGWESRWPSTISRPSSTLPSRWPSSGASWGGKVSSTSNSVSLYLHPILFLPLFLTSPPIQRHRNFENQYTCASLSLSLSCDVVHTFTRPSWNCTTRPCGHWCYSTTRRCNPRQDRPVFTFRRGRWQ